MKIKEIQVDKVVVYEFCFEEADKKIIRKVEEFANETSEETYKRSRMSDSDHRKNIVTGKMAEYAFSRLLHHYAGIDIQPNFENKVDLFDFNISGFKIDIKSSSMTTKRKRYSLLEALSSFNFMVLADQSFKDIIIQPLYPSRKEHNRFYFSVWQYVKIVIQANIRKKIKMNGGYGDYYLLLLNKGYPLSELFKKIKKGG